VPDSTLSIPAEETLVRQLFDSWENGLDAVLDSWRRHCAEDIVWWNSARGALFGLPMTLAAIENMAAATGAAHWRSTLKNVAVRGAVVFTERVDAIYRQDGSPIAEVPIAGVIEIRDGKIVQWRDYCDDWMRDHRSADAGRNLA
jgi:limonene-1,2-epoxide hydrolase